MLPDFMPQRNDDTNRACPLGSQVARKNIRPEPMFVGKRLNLFPRLFADQFRPCQRARNRACRHAGKLGNVLDRPNLDHCSDISLYAGTNAG